MKKNLFAFYLLIAVSLSAIGQSTNQFPATGNAKLFQSAGTFRGYDIQNFNSNIVSRFEATTDGTGQLWFKDAAGNYKVIIKSNSSAPSAIAGELIIGKFSTVSENRKLFVEGSSEFTGNLYGRSNFQIKQQSGSYRAYDVLNFNNKTTARFESTTDGTGQLWLADAGGTLKVAIRSKASSPSSIAGELVVGQFTSTSMGKKFYVNGDSWIAGQFGVDGNIRAEEVKVEIINGPDYVFESDYDLRSLEETEEYIASNKHLPEIPTAKVMESEGVELGEMNMLLLKKVEELTLYMIDMNKQVKSQTERIEQLEKENAALKEKVISLEEK